VPPTEPLNYSAIARTAPFSRADIDLGIKDIALGMFRVLQEKGSAVFPVPGIGRIIFRQGQARLRYDLAFCAAMNGLPPECARGVESPDDLKKPVVLNHPAGRLTRDEGVTLHPDINWHLSESQNWTQPVQLAADSQSWAQLVPLAANNSSCPPLDVILVEPSQRKDRADGSSVDETGDPKPMPRATEDFGSGGVAPRGQRAESADSLLRRLKRTILASEVSLPVIQAEVEHARKKAAVTRPRPSNPIKPPDGTHLHSNSGNRLWRDGRCPLCWAKAKQFNDIREDERMKEKDFDKMIIRLSMEIDRQLALKEKAAKEDRAKNCVEIAQYNWKTILNKVCRWMVGSLRYLTLQGLMIPAIQEEQKKAAAKASREEKIKYTKPQTRPREWDQRFAEDLKKQVLTSRNETFKETAPLTFRLQIESQRQKARADRRASELEVKLSNQQATKLLEEAKNRERLDDLHRKQLQHAALRWKIRTQKEREERDRRVDDIPFENVFVAADSGRNGPIAETAKQLLNEQIRVLNMTRENAKQEKEHQLLVSKNLLETTKKE
ncbi:MAG: hypothetical protein BJ554DRAFT_3449, partial [Olpidium bornovanus]